ncbi:MAG: DNA polymerase III subunit delta [Alphaproteobacteria bacterium ADurb.Bin438]|nr:MAG: DNA polymerase III subunit delta [Alphaproteobacteria bacterium ADurb.Bin438]
MKFEKQDLINFINNPNPSIKAFLLFGFDEGAINEAEKALANSIVGDYNNAFLCDNFEAKDLDSRAFLNSINTLSLLGERRILRIDGVDKNTLDFVNILLTEYKGDTLVIIKHNDSIKKGDKLLNLFTDNKNLGFISFYPPSEQDLKAYIFNYCKKNNKNIDNDAINFIARNNGSDHLILKSEIEKLVTYCFDKDNITLKDALEIIEDNKANSFDDFIYATLGGDYNKIVKSLEASYMEGMNPIGLIRIFYTHIDKIKNCKKFMNDGIDIKRASQMVGVHFSSAPLFNKQVMNYKDQDLDDIIKILFDFDKNCKQRNFPIEIAFENCLFKIASLKK